MQKVCWIWVYRQTGKIIFNFNWTVYKFQKYFQLRTAFPVKFELKSLFYPWGVVELFRKPDPISRKINLKIINE